MLSFDSSHGFSGIALTAEDAEERRKKNEAAFGCLLV
jgi:hypothetical protein